jgi:hypothetical protein
MIKVLSWQTPARVVFGAQWLFHTLANLNSSDNPRWSPYLFGHAAYCVPLPKTRPTPPGTLRTIREVCDYMTGMGKNREVLTHWQRVAKLILAQADAVNVSRAPLFMDAKLDVSKVAAE